MGWITSTPPALAAGDICSRAITFQGCSGNAVTADMIREALSSRPTQKHPRPNCYKCGKPATKLCDHRDFIMRREVTKNGRVWFRRIASMETCSKPLCDECAITEDGMDFCQEHGDYYHTVLVTKEANRIYEEMIRRIEQDG